MFEGPVHQASCHRFTTLLVGQNILIHLFSLVQYKDSYIIFHLKWGSAGAEIVINAGRQCRISLFLLGSTFTPLAWCNHDLEGSLLSVAGQLVQSWWLTSHHPWCFFSIGWRSWKICKPSNGELRYFRKNLISIRRCKYGVSVYEPNQALDAQWPHKMLQKYW